jgi:hypothetical protein
MARSAVCALLLLLCSAPAVASAQEDMVRRAVGAELTFGRIDEDHLLALVPKLALEIPELWMPGCKPSRPACWATLRLGMHIPLRLVVDDEAPLQDGAVRAEDWDEPGDYLRVLRYFSYGDPGQPLSVRLGELGPLTVGGGTLVYNHFNTLTPDNFRPGARLAAGSSTIYVDLFVDNVTAPSLVGGALLVRPLGFIAEDDKPTALGLGLSVFSDINAPTVLARDADGGAVVDLRRYPSVMTSQPTTWIGGRVAYDVLANDEGSNLSVSLDGNAHLEVGQGGHLGAHYTLVGGLTLLADAELILGSAGYLPRALGPTYAIDRYQLDGHGQALPAPALRVAATLRDEASGLHRAAFGHVGVASQSGMRAELSYQHMFDTPGADMALLQLSAQLMSSTRLGLFMFSSGADTSKLLRGRNTLLASELRLDLLPLLGDPGASSLYLVGRWGQSWRLSDAGEYTTVPDWNVGIGGAW